MSWIQHHPKGCQIYLKVIPGARKSEITGIYDNRIKMKIHAPANDGKANQELLKWWQKNLNTRLQNLEIIQGELQSFKTLLIQNINQEEALKKITPFLKLTS